MAQQLTNTGFESTTVPTTGYVTGSKADSTWTFQGSAGVYSANCRFNGNGAVLLAPNGGSKAAFLWVANAVHGGSESRLMEPNPQIQQIFKITSKTTYTLSFYSAQQNTSTNAHVLVASLRHLSNSDPFRDIYVTPTTSFAQTSVALGTLLADTYVLTFSAIAPPFVGKQGTTTFSGTVISGMVFLDDVSVI